MDCGLLWCYCDVIIVTLILTAPIHCRASIAETHFSKPDEETNSSTSRMTWGWWAHVQQTQMCVRTLSSRCTAFSRAGRWSLSGPGWGAPWGRSSTCSTRWRRDRWAERRRCRRCTGAVFQRRRKTPESRSRSPAGRPDAACEETARSGTLYCCDARPTRCCSGSVPMMPSPYRPSRAWEPICRRCRQQT